MSRPVFLYEQIALAAYTSVGPPIVPSQVLSTPTNFKAPSKMQVDHIFLTERGLEGSAVVNPRTLWAEAWDNKRHHWSVNPVPIEHFNNSVRQRMESRQYGPFQTVAIGGGGNYVIPVGEHVIVPNGAALLLQQNVPGWVGTGQPAGAVMSDGANVRVLNVGAPGSIQIQRIDQYGPGEWWLPRPFRIEKQHSFTLKVWNRMAVATRFLVVFQAVGELTKRTFLLDQDITLAAGASQSFATTGLDVTSEEALIVKLMSYCPHPEAVGFDPRRIEMIIEPSQGGAWTGNNNDYIPLLAYSNVRGDYVEAFHVPNYPMIWEQNDFIQFKFWNYAPAARVLLAVVAAHTVESDEDIVQ